MYINKQVYINIMNSLQFKCKTDTTFMSSENIEIFDPHKLLLDSTDKIIKKIKINKKNKITRSSIFEYLLLKVKINYTQYFKFQ